MHEDFGTLVDYLRGELEEPALVAVRQRLESDAAFFEQFNRLRRTFAVLRCLPRLDAAGKPMVVPPSLPQFEPTAAFLADLQREFAARGWVSLLPELVPAPLFVAALRMEFTVRALFACMPGLVPGPQLLRSLRDEFSVRGIAASLPFARVRAEWVRALRNEFVVRATVDCVPRISVRPEYAAALRAEFAQRALADAVPQLEVSDRFRRRLQVAMFESQRDAAPAEAAPALPAVAAGDSFRRRLFKRILLSSRRQLNRGPMKLDSREYQLGRVMAGAWRRGKRSVGATLTLHALAVIALFFVWDRVTFVAPQPAQAIGMATSVVPPLPGNGRGPQFIEPPKLVLTVPEADTRLPSVSDDFGLGGDDAPLPARPEYDPEPVAPERNSPDQVSDTRPDLRSDNGAWFRLRSASKSAKIAYLGSSELYEALGNALAWLQRVQQVDGGWGHVDVRLPTRDEDLVAVQRLEMTSAALLAFLGDGHSSKSSLLGYDYNVKRGVDWLLANQRSDGRIGPVGRQVVLGHAMATLVLIEDFAMSRDARLRIPLRNACRWLAAVRAADGSGGFPYMVGQDASLMTSVWAYMALASARSVRVPELDAPQARMDGLLNWFERETKGFTTLKDTQEVLARTDLLPTSSAAALSQFAVDAGYEMRRASFLGRLGRELPSVDPASGGKDDTSDMRYLFFGSLGFALEQQRTGGTSPWQAEMSRTLLAHQLKTGGHSGSFDASCDYAQIYGRVFSTAFAALAIENAYRVQLIK